jgi:hypothetical protein
VIGFSQAENANMKAMKTTLIIAMLVLAATASESAFARRGGHFGGRHFAGPRVAVGVTAVAPAFLYFPPALPSSVVAVSTEPQVYIERSDAQPASSQPAGEWWYYCADSKAYYPYVNECAQAWQRVATEPPNRQ